VEYEAIDDPPYTVKISFMDEEGVLWAVYKGNQDHSRYSYIVRDEHFFIEPDNREIRQFKYEEEEGKVHAQLLFYRALANDMNDLIEAWDDGSRKKIKCVRVYGLEPSEAEFHYKLSFSLVVDLTTAKATGVYFERRGAGELVENPKVSPAIFDNKWDLVEQGIAEIPGEYPPTNLAYQVHNAGVNINDVANFHIDENTLESNL